MRRAFAIVAVIALASLYPKPSFAIQDEVDRIFYNGCGPNRVQVGEIFTDCAGDTVSWGDVTDFEERHTTSGCSGTGGGVTYWECGYQVSSLNSCIC